MSIELASHSAGRNSSRIPYETTALKVCLAETESQVRQQVARAIEDAGHTVILARKSGDIVRQCLNAGGADVVVGCAQMLQASEMAISPAATAPALLLARPADSGFLPVFMRSHPSNDFAVLPQPDGSLRACVSNFLRHQQRRRMLCSSSFGSYLLMRDTRQVFFANASVTLSPYRFALAETLFKNAGAALTDSMLYLSARSGPRPDASEPPRDIRRLIDANLALLAHVLELDGSHGYRLKRGSPAGYCLESELSASSQLAAPIFDAGDSGLAASELNLKLEPIGIKEGGVERYLAH